VQWFLLIINALLRAQLSANNQLRALEQEQIGAAAGLPSPGVFARHNAVDVPALLPDGTPAPTSISATLKGSWRYVGIKVI
jgi:NADH-quinone oxidoreductase subunit J